MNLEILSSSAGSVYIDAIFKIKSGPSYGAYAESTAPVLLYLLQLRDKKELDRNKFLCADDVRQKLVVRVDKITGQGAIEFEINISESRNLGVPPPSSMKSSNSVCMLVVLSARYTPSMLELKTHSLPDI